MEERRPTHRKGVGILRFLKLLGIPRDAGMKA